MKGWDTQGCQDREMTLWKPTLCLMHTARPDVNHGLWVKRMWVKTQGHRVQERVPFKIEMVYINYFLCLCLC